MTTWRWRMLGADGNEVKTAEVHEFTSRSDAESWVGTTWQDLRTGGVRAVLLLEGDQEVAPPMSLDP